MATTTNYGWTTPDDTALVKDGASAIRSLGSSIDTTLKAQIDAQIPDSLLTTKGDIIAATAASTPSRLASSAVNGDVLQVDTSTATGLKWAAPASGGMTLISTTTMTGASTITVSSIPATYNDLRLVIRNFKPSNDNGRADVRFNGDSNARYTGPDYATSQFTRVFGSTEITTGIVGNDNSVANGLTIITIPDYANTTTWKWVQLASFSTDSTTTTSVVWQIQYAVYNQTGAISSVSFVNPAASNFTSGSILCYGVK